MKNPTYPERYMDTTEWQAHGVTITVIPLDTRKDVTTLNLKPEDVDPHNQPGVIGLGAYLGGNKHGVRRELGLPGRQGEWRISVYEHRFLEGTVLMQRVEVKR